MSIETKTSSFYEGRNQYYEAALRERLASQRDDDDVLEAVYATRLLLQNTQSPSTDAVVSTLVALAHKGLQSTKTNDVKNLVEELTPWAISQTVEVAVDLSLKRIQAKKKLWAEDPKSSLLRAQFEEALHPSALNKVTGGCRHVWDVRHDGHLVQRELARCLGILRWARAQTPDRFQRTIEAFRRSESYGSGASEVWVQRRPIIFVENLSWHSLMLIMDLWAYDSQIAVVCTNRPKKNHLSLLNIPLVIDDKGYLKALLAVDEYPTLIEPRLGGFTLTAACGVVDLSKRIDFSIPAWVRTMAEIGVLKHFKVSHLLKEVNKQRPLDRSKYLQRLKKLMSMSIQTHYNHEPSEDQRAYVQAIRRQTIDGRNELLAQIEKFEQKALVAAKHVKAHVNKKTGHETV